MGRGVEAVANAEFLEQMTSPTRTIGTSLHGGARTPSRTDGFSEFGDTPRRLDQQFQGERRPYDEAPAREPQQDNRRDSYGYDRYDDYDGGQGRYDNGYAQYSPRYRDDRYEDDRRYDDRRYDDRRYDDRRYDDRDSYRDRYNDDD